MRGGNEGKNANIKSANRVLLLTLPFDHVSSVLPPMGLLYIAAVLEKNNVPVKIVDANALKMSYENIVDETKKFSPQIIGVSVPTAQLGHASKASKLLKEALPDSLIVFGGPHPSVMPEECLSHNAGVAVIGEGEETFLEIAQVYDGTMKSLESVKGIAFMQEGKVERAPPRGLIHCLDSLPFPARHLVPMEKYFTIGVAKRPFATILTSRGCPGKCIYCNKSVFTSIFRVRSPENVVAEIKMLVREYGVKEIDILDDTFTLDANRAERICLLIVESDIKVSWRCSNGLRADAVSEELLKKMKNAGCHQVAFGVESGNDAVLRKIGKETNREQIKRAFGWAKKAGLETVGFFMIGLPFDTKETMQETIDFAIELDPDYAQFTIATPLPGTMLNKWVKENTPFEGYSSFESFDFFGSNAYFETGNFTKQDAVDFSKKAYLLFYYRPRYMLKTLLRMRSPQEIRAKLVGLKTLLGLTKK